MTEAGFPVADQAVLHGVDRQHVGVTRTLRTEADRTTHTRVRADRFIQIDLHGGEVVAAQAVRQILGFLAADRELGREGVGPVREQLSLVGRQVLVDLIGRGQQADADVGAVGDRVVQAQIAALGLLVRDHGAVLVVDVPVQLGEVFLVLDRQGVGRPVERVVAVDALGDVADLVDLGLGDARRLVDGARAFRTRQDRPGRFILLVVQQEEQAILDDRTAEGRAPGLLFELAGQGTVLTLARDEILVAEAVAAQAVVGDFPEGFAVELVAARLGDRVDHAAGEAAVLDAVRGDVDADRLQHRTRDRRAQGRVTVGVQAEVVALLDPVDQHGVVAGVLAADRQGVVVRRVHRGERGRAHDIFDVAADGRQRLDVFQVQASGRRGAHSTHAAHDHFGHFGRAGVGGHGRNGHVEHGRSADADAAQLSRLGLAVDHHRHRVRAADAQVARGVQAFFIGDRRGAGARRNVGDDDGRIGHRRAGRVRDHAPDAAR